jgi:tripartite-type tricarboxylate transporter receptor subunit TctC
MDRRKFIKTASIAGIAGVAGCSELGGGGDDEEFPSEDVTVVHPYGPASSPAGLSLLIQDIINEEDLLPVDIRTEERTGGGGIIGYNSVADAEDGHTISDAVTPSMLLKPFESEEAQYDPRELTYVASGSEDIQTMAVPTDSEIETAQDYVDALIDGAQFSAVSQTSSLVVLLMAMGDETDLYDPGIVLDRLVTFGIGETAAAAIRGDVALAGLDLSVVANFVEDDELRIVGFFTGDDGLPDRAQDVAPDADTLDDLGLSSSQIETVTGSYPQNITNAWFGPPEMTDEAQSTLEDAWREAIESDTYESEVIDRNLGQPNFRPGDEVEEIVTNAYNQWDDRDELTQLWRE